jgi:TonB dependent receptor/TonB-dependent Receptor Plug Domain
MRLIGSTNIFLICSMALLHPCASQSVQSSALNTITSPPSGSTLSVVVKPKSPFDIHPAEPLAPPAVTIAPHSFGTVISTVEVHALDLSSLNISPAQDAVRAEIQSAAGSYGDFSRYLLVMPGVSGSGNSDTMNDILVRGGHPSENLYVIDGVEIPYINHFAIEGTSSGFTPMLNTNSIEKLALQPGAYDAQYSSRLSSLIDIQTRNDEGSNASEISAGIAGAGGFWEHPLGQLGNALLAFDRSLFNLATSNMGLDGVPIYTNGMARIEWSPGKADHISFLNLSGADSISIAPCAGDPSESLYIDTQYGGLRSNSGFTWLHTHGPTSVSKFTVSFASQRLEINQQDQEVNGVYQRNILGNGDCTPKHTMPVYAENTLDRLTTLGYNLRHDINHWLLSVGATAQLVNLNYAVSQPAGVQSPFNPSPAWSDSDTFHSTPQTRQTGSYAELAGPLGKRWTALASVRVETFGLTNASAVEPSAGLGFRINNRQAVHAAYRRSAQLPPYIDLLSYPQNHNLLPISVEQASAGADLWRSNAITLSVEAYRKLYFDEPASTEYPSLMLANMVYSPGGQMVWLPLTSAGKGKASGLEILLRGHWASRVSVLASLTDSHVKYAALDGVLRAGNYDIPLMGHGIMTYHLRRTWNLSVRDSYTAGLPYTPFNIQLSLAQDRGIYDLSKVNTMRGPAYNRADVSFDHNFQVHRGVLNLYAGVQNIFDRKNFLGYIWLNRCEQQPKCMAMMNDMPILEVYQMPAFPVAGLRWDF